MKITYLSSLCSLSEYERLFKTYGTTSSHASQRFHRLMTRGFVEHGVEVETITHRSVKSITSEAMTASTECAEGLTFHYLPQSRHTKWNRLYAIAAAYRKLRALSKAQDKMFVCVDILRGELSIAATLFRCFHSCKIVGIVTDVPAFRASETRRGLRALPVRFKNFLISRYDAYVFLTDKMNETLNPCRKPYTIIEGIADDHLFLVEDDQIQKYPEKVIMMAGLLETQFGVDDLVRAFHNLEQEDIRLHLYGKGKSVALIEEYAEKDTRIRFWGERLNQEIVEEEQKAVLLVNPRQAVGEWIHYSFPSKNIEYISSGTPLLAYTLPCEPSEYQGKYFTVGEEGLEATLRCCLKKSKEELYSFGKEAQRWILENKNPKVQTKKIIDMLLELE